LPEDEDLTKE